MNLERVVSHPRTITLGSLLSRHTPVKLGHKVAWWLSGLVCRFQPAIYDVLRANVGQALGPETEPAELERTIRQIFYHFLRSYYDLFRALRLPYEELVASVHVPEPFRVLMTPEGRDNKPLILVTPHVGNFDLAGQVVARYTTDMQVLSLPDPHPGFRSLNTLRERGGARVTPLSPAALRQAIQTLRRGGVVVVGGDRPVSGLDEPVPFFGRPARVPSGHVRLALRSDAIVVMACCALDPETDRYRLLYEEPLPMIHTGNREEEVALNMWRILHSLETMIRRWIDQWMMFVPVWPELLEE
ncbi:MAG: lysophospholipid acyltransferase family protein [Anaerolineae bacterium]